MCNKNFLSKGIWKFYQYLQYLQFRSEIRSTDVFIVSYPKSGTTWLSFLIANSIKTETTGPVTLKNSTKYIPDINKLYLKKKGYLEDNIQYFRNLSSPRVFKVHSPYDRRLHKVVYLLRDPRDVMLSYWHYMRMTNAAFSISLDTFIAKNDKWPCDWNEHVSSWLLSNEAGRLLLIRYEDLHRETEASLKRVLEFIGISCTEGSIRKSVEASKFENMKKIEEVYGSAEQNISHGERFVRKGKINNWIEEMDMGTVKLLEKRYGKVMEKVGYSAFQG